MRKRFGLFMALLLAFSFAAGCESLTAPKTDQDNDQEERNTGEDDPGSAAIPGYYLNFA